MNRWTGHACRRGLSYVSQLQGGRAASRLAGRAGPAGGGLRGMNHNDANIYARFPRAYGGQAGSGRKACRHGGMSAWEGSSRLGQSDGLANRSG